MTTNDIKQASAAGNSNWEVLHMVVAAGREFPDASWAVTHALRLKPDEVEQMERDYDECC
jgi:methyl coenzyme M reductase subunit C